MAEERIAKVGEYVIFTDPKGVDHDALVTVVHGPYCINLVRLSDNENETDQYGRQIKRENSVSVSSAHTAHGYYFRFLGEPKKEYTPPIAT